MTLKSILIVCGYIRTSDKIIYKVELEVASKESEV